MKIRILFKNSLELLHNWTQTSQNCYTELVSASKRSRNKFGMTASEVATSRYAECLLLSILAFLLTPYEVLGAIPTKGSLSRCKEKEGNRVIIPVDNLLPEHYADAASMHTAMEKMREVTPNQMLQSVVDHLLSYHDLCGEKVAGVGGWEDGIGTALCERLGAFDITHDTILSGLSSLSISKNTALSPSELTFLQTVYKACRPSTDRYWNYPSLVHVSYQPTSEEMRTIYKLMGHSEWTF